MYINVDCGICQSTINVDSEWEESAWLMLYRFADAHVKCGTFTDRTELPFAPTAAVEDEGSDPGAVA